MQYVELHCKTNFSFLEGASHADELVQRANELGYGGLAITDRESLAGVVRAFGAARDVDFPLIIGAEIWPADSLPMVLWVTDRAAYGRLCRLLSRGRMRGEKGSCELSWADVLEFQEGLLAGVLYRPGIDAQSSKTAGQWIDQLGQVRDLFGDRAYLLAELHRGVDDVGLAAELKNLSLASEIPLVAAGDVHYHTAERMLMHDCVTAIRNGTTIDRVHGKRFSNSQRHLRSLAEVNEVYRNLPDAVARTVEIAERCHFQLSELRYEYPEELAPDGQPPLEYLKRLTWKGAKQRWPAGVPTKIIDALRHEMQLIEELGYEAYFLTVWDLVRFAREQNILCQGRGSAANSVVCYCLGITSVDPSQTELLFERFISRERNEAPDIDVDFEHQRREEVLQYLYSKYGRERAGLTATVVTYRLRSAVREVGKVLGVSPDTIDILAKYASSRGTQESLASRYDDAGLDTTTELGKRFLYLTDTLLGFPRHLSQHVGGMVMTNGALCELCPIENAAMEGRTVIQWDKDDLDELGILKVDVLALGMLSAIQRCFALITEHHGKTYSLATIPDADKATYDMICAADTVGVFQIESRAQMSMLPRLRPRCFYDLVIEVAIVRPGPIQGNMVHPFLKARQNPGSVQYPNDAIRGVLERTMGVPIFQEQAMRLAVVAAGFTPGEADQLRRAMAAWRRPGVIERFRVKLMEGMQRNGLDETFAEQVFHQIKGFGEYGFPESHAASFALLVYASCYLKRHYPAAFCVGLLNSQPMGFYAPAQLIADAQKHGVSILPADVNASDWEATLVRLPSTAASPADDPPSVRLGLAMVRGLPAAITEQIIAERQRNGLFQDLTDLNQRLQLGQAVLQTLADADALGSLAKGRRAALWEAYAHESKCRELPLLDGLDDDSDEATPEALLPMSPMEDVHADYRTTGISLKGHPIQFCRQKLEDLSCVTAASLPGTREGRQVRIAGMVLLRQRPGSAKGVTFATLEDETGTMNLVLFPAVWEKFYKIAQTSNAWLVQGTLENQQSIVHVIVSHVEDLTSSIEGLQSRSRDFR
ncbi:Error-prone DNA polymerase [Roseimaritima multifibrata]|uniref:Error-prone DNA polymerase n=1 Tax=Roseimaritima multifibrata TaxID=1930274 RepID=A0A517MFL9_9BACT|nr:error-prone DNA polymerase [Roseimaritima multifibrata]QDS93680.1 Error-prone DNA polymerase [Roseimaritima multifibrata]